MHRKNAKRKSQTQSHPSSGASELSLEGLGHRASAAFADAGKASDYHGRGGIGLFLAKGLYKVSTKVRLGKGLGFDKGVHYMMPSC